MSAHYFVGNVSVCGVGTCAVRSGERLSRDDALVVVDRS